ncbi:UNVERIFIED_CONTAM: hypothetical protein HDU68_009506 [Siphonaria sp. JEL0065]|nr:hypothetical protein HDU68_009506 [Siphonaria sp. JEL0065]
MASLSPECTPLKVMLSASRNDLDLDNLSMHLSIQDAYYNCFNKWYADELLKGSFSSSGGSKKAAVSNECQELFEKYKDLTSTHYAERKATNKYYPPDWDPSKNAVYQIIAGARKREVEYDPADNETMALKASAISWHTTKKHSATDVIHPLFHKFFATSHQSRLWENKMLPLAYGEDRERLGFMAKVDYTISDEETGKICVVFFCHQFNTDDEEEELERDPADLRRKVVQGLFAAACHNRELDSNETVYGVLIFGPRYVIYEFWLDDEAVTCVIE